MKSIPYYGGKSLKGSSSKVGTFVADILPYKKGYMEPFAGMANVLLRRGISRVEIINDKDEFVINWWRCIRDHPDETIWKIKHTPRSRSEFNRAWHEIKSVKLPLCDKGDVDIAVCFYIIVKYSYLHGIGGKKSRFTTRYDVTRGPERPIDVSHLCDRLSGVQLESMDALDMLKKVKDMDTYSIYIDPPYRDADKSPYRVSNFDRVKLAELIADQKNHIAISGYNDEWDHLDWDRTEFNTFRSTNSKNKNILSKREEVVWTNFKVNL